MLSRMPDEYVLSFEDQLPGAAVLTTSTASVVGAFNCNPGGDISQQSIRVLLNDNYVDGGPIKTPNSMGCWCPNCGTPITVQLSEKVMKAQYFKGQQNHISICLTNNLPGNFLCLGEVDMKVYFKVSEPRVTSVVPLFGPASGGTVITVGGDNFSPSLETECLFGGKTRTKATIISDTKLQCSTPNGVTLNTTSFGLVIKVLENEYTFSSKFLFKFYKGGEISGVTPRKASHKTSTRIRVFGQFEETGMYRCRFSSHSATRTVGGTLSDDGSTITCYAPTWNKKETVNLTISLNDQQYSKPYKFRFASSKTNDIIYTLLVQPHA